MTAFPADLSADQEHLRLLTIFHYVLAGVVAVFGCFPLIHVVIGIAILAHWGVPVAPASGGQKVPEFVGWLFVMIGSVLIMMFWALAVVTFLAGRNLAHRRRYMFCFVVACLQTPFMPFGTALGVFTIVVLSRPSVKHLFGRGAPAAAQ